MMVNSLKITITKGFMPKLKIKLALFQTLLKLPIVIKSAINQIVYLFQTLKFVKILRTSVIILFCTIYDKRKTKTYLIFPFFDFKISKLKTALAFFNTYVFIKFETYFIPVQFVY